MLERKRDSFMRKVRVLAEDLEARWRAVAYDHQRFPRLAAEALTRHACHESFDFDRFARWYVAGEGVMEPGDGSGLTKPRPPCFRPATSSTNSAPGCLQPNA